MLFEDLDIPLDTGLGVLRLRALSPGDAQPFAAHLRADMPRIAEHLRWPETGCEEAGAREILQRYQHGRASIVGVWEGDTLIGGSLLMDYDELAASIELGVWMTARGAGTGAAAAACRVLVAAARQMLAVKRIAWVTATDNPRSLALAERLGFQREGVMRQAFVLRGERKDAWLLSLVGSEIDRCAT